MYVIFYHYVFLTVIIKIYFSGENTLFSEDQVSKSFNISFDLTKASNVFYCSLCNYSSSDINEISTHHKIHNLASQNKLYLSGDDRPFSCSIYKKTFKNRSHLKSHMVTHTKERPYQCDLCSKSFGLKWNLRAHMLTHKKDY